MKIRGANQVGAVPPNYRCYKCHQGGHWIKDCTFGQGPVSNRSCISCTWCWWKISVKGDLNIYLLLFSNHKIIDSHMAPTTNFSSLFHLCNLKVYAMIVYGPNTNNQSVRNLYYSEN